LFFILIAVVLGLVILGGLATGVFSEYARAGGFGTAAAALVLLILITAFFSMTTVGARNVGIQTEFGRYKSTLDSGFQWTSPVSSVEEFSTQIQPLDLGGDSNPVAVNFQGGGRGSVDATIRWRIDADNAEFLWRKYRTFDNVRDQLVNSAAKDSLRVVVGKYLPNDARAGENVRPITAQVKDDLENTLKADGIIIDSVSLKGIFLDDATQKSLERTVIANNNIETAKSEQERAKIDAETAKIRQDSGSLSDANLTRYCLEVVNAWDVHKNGNLPGGFSCFGPNGAVVTTK
jgi:regulator of protease activity HflC (stomatin/prohibitin superfamily)